MIFNITYKFTLILCVFFLTTVGWSHGGEDHDSVEKKDADSWETVSKGPSKEKLAKINNLYLKNIKPIFKTKCISCHGKADKLPWYATIPGPKQLIEHDIEEAQEHMNMTLDFPFSGHGDAKSDLESLSETVDKNEMPPWQYKMIHWDSSLTSSEKLKIKKWVSESLKILKE